MPRRVRRLPARLASRSGREVAFIGIDSGDTTRADALAFLRSLPRQLSELLRPQRAGRREHHRLDLHSGDRLLRSPRRRVHPPGPLPEPARSSNRTSAATRWTPDACPSCGSTRSAGTGRSSPASARGARGASRAARRPSRSTPSSDPFAEGHEDRTPPELYAVRPGRRPARTRPAGRCGSCRTCIPALAPASAEQRRRPAHATSRARGRGRSCSRSLPGDRRARGDRQRAAAGAVAGRAPARAGRRRRRGLARAHARARRQRLRAADRQRAPRGGRVAAAHARPAVRARLRAGRGRARARALPAPTRRARWARTCSATSSPRRCAARERIVAIDDEAVLMAPYASRLPFQLMLAPRAPRAALRGRRALGRGAAARRPAPAGAPPRLEPAAEPVGAHRAARQPSTSAGGST